MGAKRYAWSCPDAQCPKGGAKTREGNSPPSPKCRCGEPFTVADRTQPALAPWSWYCGNTKKKCAAQGVPEYGLEKPSVKTCVRCGHKLTVLDRRGKASAAESAARAASAAASAARTAGRAVGWAAAATGGRAGLNAREQRQQDAAMRAAQGKSLRCGCGRGLPLGRRKPGAVCARCSKGKLPGNVPLRNGSVVRSPWEIHYGSDGNRIFPGHPEW